MNSKNIFSSIAILMILLFTTHNSEAQNNNETSNLSSDAKIEVIQFHSEHRCMTCNKIEQLSKEALKDFPDIPFTLVNVDDEKNENIVEEFEAFGTSLFLYNTATGKKQNLTEFAFMNAGNEEKFITEIQKKIQAFQIF